MHCLNLLASSVARLRRVGTSLHNIFTPNRVGIKCPFARFAYNGKRKRGFATIMQPMYFTYHTPHGPVTIAAVDDFIVRVEFGSANMSGTRQPTAATNRAATQIQEYFAGKRTTFDMPIAPEGSDFQRNVWTCVERIPYASTATSIDIARQIGKPDAYRSVGAAVKRNPLALIIPTHRVVGTTGKPLGNGRLADINRALLAFERKTMQDPKIF